MQEEADINKDGIFLTEQQNVFNEQQKYKDQELVNMQVAVQNEDDEDIEVVYSEEELASFWSIFDMFDKTGTGYIHMRDF